MSTALEILPRSEPGTFASPRKRSRPFDAGAGVRIYKTSWSCKKRQRKYKAFTIVWRDASGREQREKKSDEAKARKRAELIATSMLNGESALAKFSQAKMASFLRAEEVLAKVGSPAIELVAVIYTQCVENLPAGVTLRDLRDYWDRGHPAGILAHTSEQVVEEFFAKRTMGPKWRRILKKMLERFVARFSGALNELQSRSVDDWLDSLKLGLRSRANYRAAIANLLNFAKARGYLPKDSNILADVSDPEVPEVEINIYTPEELRRLLHTAEKTKAGQKMIPFMCISAFCGVRHGEMNEDKTRLLDWADIDFEAKAINIAHGTSKTKNSRTVDMPDNLIAWLRPYANPRGKICCLSNTADALCALRAKAGILGNKRNALRKSFITYSKALNRNIEAVADQAGNSPAIIRKHYMRIDTKLKADAASWFKIMPTQAGLSLFTWGEQSAG